MSKNTDITMVRMKYLGRNRGPVGYMGISGTTYRSASRPPYLYHDVLPEDVQTLLNTRKFEVVEDEQVQDKDDDPDPVPILEKAEPKVLDLSTIGNLKASISGASIQDLKATLEVEKENKNRKRAVAILENEVDRLA